MLAREHAAEFQSGDALLETVEVRLDAGHGTLVVFADSQFEQFAGIVDGRAQLLDAADYGLQRGALAAELLGSRRVIPDTGFTEFELDFGQALLLAIVVKDTP
jgi:hypothetical protein